jgi:hypothetical protein
LKLISDNQDLTDYADNPDRNEAWEFYQEIVLNEYEEPKKDDYARNVLINYIPVRIALELAMA